MEARRHYEAAQNFIDALTETKSDERHVQQRLPHENRAQRRERERNERRAAKKVRA